MDQKFVDQIKGIEKLQKQLHANDPEPATREEQNAKMTLDSVQGIVMLMVQNGVNVDIIEISLFYHWFRLITLINMCDESDFSRWSSDLGSIMVPLIDRLKLFASEIEDSGPSQEMAELGSRLEKIKSFISKKSKLDDLSSDVEAANKGIWGLTAVLMEKYEVNPVLIQNTLLYYWLRTATINHGIDEALFQKWERNWETLITEVDKFFKEWSKTI